MNIPIDKFIKVVPKGSVFEVIRVTEENMKYIYTYLKNNKCELFPDEKLAAGQIWLFDTECKDCIAYDDESFNDGVTWLEFKNES